jgi:hypothetical protein
MTDQTRMDWLLDKYVSEGRIAQTSRAAWAGRYANDSAGTEAVLAALTPTPIGVHPLHGSRVRTRLHPLFWAGGSTW